MIACFAIPPAVLMEHWLLPKAQTKAPHSISYLIYVWYLISLQLLGMFFPDLTESPLLTNYSTYGVGVILVYVAVMLLCRKKWATNAIFKRVWDFDIFTCWLIGYIIIRVFQNKNVSLWFVGFSLLLYLAFFYQTGKDVRKVWATAGLKLRALLLCLMCILMISNLNLFGSSQFGRIDRRVGGGKPETAYIKFSEQHSQLAFLFNIPAATTFCPSNTFVGPIELLLRSDKELIFVNPAEMRLPDYLTNNITTNLTAYVTSVTITNVSHYPITNGDGKVAQNSVTNLLVLPQTNYTQNTTNYVVKNPVKVTARQVRADVVDAIIFAK